MRARVRPIATTVIALKPTDRTVTQTDRAPSLMRAAAMAPAVMVAMRGMNMGLLSFEQKKTRQGSIQGGFREKWVNSNISRLYHFNFR